MRQKIHPGLDRLRMTGHREGDIMARADEDQVTSPGPESTKMDGGPVDGVA